VKAEEIVAALHPSSLIIRTSAFFGPWDKYNFLSEVLYHLERGLQYDAAADIIISPTYIPHLVNASLDLLIDDEYGIWHVTNNDHITWYELARETAARAGMNASLVNPVKEIPWLAKRPAYSVLQSERGVLLPSLETALGDFFKAKQEGVER
jgi:dTDP-4-dehydrorhamnose reductase